jgi:hypothetical protein
VELNSTAPSFLAGPISKSIRGCFIRFFTFPYNVCSCNSKARGLLENSIWTTLLENTIIIWYIYIYIYIYIYRVSQKECARLLKNVPYVKVHRYNPKNLYPKLNGYVDKGQRNVWYTCGSTYCTCSAVALPVHCACAVSNVNL